MVNVIQAFIHIRANFKKHNMSFMSMVVEIISHFHPNIQTQGIMVNVIQNLYPIICPSDLDVDIHIVQKIYNYVIRVVICIQSIIQTYSVATNFHM